ncbi:hypothetical protein [uncultured Sphingomonas sp.]|uniref:hypothetical protein n=1 Tax=uncultured Sphingomonas sp. TaxID=158754 RepID=UPI0025D60E4F|nr:hypothetical protein [uncultured Sphingomonas sp.]
MPVPPEAKRYTIRLLTVMTLYGVTLVAVNLWFRHAPPSGLLAYLAAVLPALPIALVFVVIGKFLMEMRDEYIRAQMVHDLMIVTGATLSITTAWGFLEGFGLVGPTKHYYVATLWFSLTGVAACIRGLMRRREA